MPRRKPKTAADRPPTKVPTPMALPPELEPFVAGMELERIVQRFGVEDIQLVLNILAEQSRRELIARRSSEVRDAWKTNVRPLGPVQIPHLSALRTSRDSRRSPGYRRHREEHLDSVIRKQERAGELEDGLAVLLERGLDAWECRELSEIVTRVAAGETTKQIARALDTSERTVERRLEELRAACPECGLNGGLRPDATPLIEG